MHDVVEIVGKAALAVGCASVSIDMALPANATVHVSCEVDDRPVDFDMTVQEILDAGDGLDVVIRSKIEGDLDGSKSADREQRTTS